MKNKKYLKKQRSHEIKKVVLIKKTTCLSKRMNPYFTHMTILQNLFDKYYESINTDFFFLACKLYSSQSGLKTFRDI